MKSILKSIQEEYKSYITEHMEENAASASTVEDFLYHSPAYYHGRVHVHPLQIPKVFSQDTIRTFQNIVQTAYRIFTKVIREYLDHPEYRKSFPFSKELAELILVPNLYDSLLPMARFDIFFNEEDHTFKFCEINTDGTSAMNEDRLLNQTLKYNPAHTHVKKSHRFQSFELFDTWVKTCLSLYDTYEKKVENPHIAIVDFLENGSVTEFEEFKKRFQKYGCSCEVCEITKMKYRNHVLYSPSGQPVNLIYRRAVTTDIMARYDEVQDFIGAVKNQDVCVMGSFCTQIIHNKWLFKALREQPTLNLLTKEEQLFVKEHIPYTNLLDEHLCDVNQVTEDKDRWIIKPLDSYASKGVFAGMDYSKEEWNAVVMKNLNKGYIYQEYCPPYRTENICFTDQEAKFKPYSNMSGLYVYDGTFQGVYSRLSDGGIISSQYNEKEVATLVLKK